MLAHLNEQGLLIPILIIQSSGLAHAITAPGFPLLLTPELDN